MHRTIPAVSLLSAITAAPSASCSYPCLSVQRNRPTDSFLSETPTAVLGNWASVRHIREEQLSAGPDAIAEIFESNLAAASRKRSEDEHPRILTTRRESLSLYREVLRYSNLFVWKDDRGKVEAHFCDNRPDCLLALGVPWQRAG